MTATKPAPTPGDAKPPRPSNAPSDSKPVATSGEDMVCTLCGLRACWTEG